MSDNDIIAIINGRRAIREARLSEITKDGVGVVLTAEHSWMGYCPSNRHAAQRRRRRLECEAK